MQKEMVACSRANMNPTIRIPPPTAATTTFTVISRPEVEDEMSSAFACTLARPLVALAEEVLEAEELAKPKQEVEMKVEMEVGMEVGIEVETDMQVGRAQC